MSAAAASLSKLPRQGRPPKPLVVTECGLEKQCTRCMEFWPADTEFFYLSGTRSSKRLHSWCIACFLEYGKERKAGIPSRAEGARILKRGTNLQELDSASTRDPEPAV